MTLTPEERAEVLAAVESIGRPSSAYRAIVASVVSRGGVEVPLGVILRDLFVAGWPRTNGESLRTLVSQRRHKLAAKGWALRARPHQGYSLYRVDVPDNSP